MLPCKSVILHPDTFFVISCFPQAFYFNWIWWLTWQHAWEWKVRLGALSIFSTTTMIRHESSEQLWGPTVHRSGNHIIQSTNKHRSVMSLTKWLLKQFKRSRPVNTCGRRQDGDEGEGSSAARSCMAIKHSAHALALPGFHHYQIVAAQSANCEKACLSSH